MKSKRSLPDLAAKVLRDDAHALGEPSGRARADVLRAISEAMRRRKRAHAIRRAAYALASLAAAAALVVALRPTSPEVQVALVRGESHVLRAGTDQPAPDGAALHMGDHVTTGPGARLTVMVSKGTSLALGERADLHLVSGGPMLVFGLAQGTVRADVAKLKPSSRFLIRTDDAEVEVRGTSFEVTRAPSDPTCGEGTTTRVSVHEGVVAVRSKGRETLVRASEVWPAECGPRAVVQAPPPEGVASASIAEASPASSRGMAPRPLPVGTPPVADSSGLADQNDRFERALSRKRAGDAAGAVEALDALLARYPSTHLAQSARAERMKLLVGIDRAQARAAAREYLRRYPTGFARADAQSIGVE